MDEWVAGAIGLVLGSGLWFLFSYILQRDAKSKANAIIEEATRDAEAKFKESDLKIKERELESKAKAEREITSLREKQLDREREIDKRETSVNQRSDDLKKQERIIESMQNRLKVKLENAVQRGKRPGRHF